MFLDQQGYIELSKSSCLSKVEMCGQARQASSANRKINSSDDIPYRETYCVTGSHERCCYIASWASGDVNQGKAETVCKMSELITTSCFHYLIARVKEEDRLSRPHLGTAHTYWLTFTRTA